MVDPHHYGQVDSGLIEMKGPWINSAVDSKNFHGSKSKKKPREVHDVSIVPYKYGEKNSSQLESKEAQKKKVGVCLVSKLHGEGASAH